MKIDGDRSDFVTVAVIYSQQEHVCFTSYLRAYGLNPYVVADNHGRMYPIIVALGGYRVRVPMHELDEALNLIELIEHSATPTGWSVWRVVNIVLCFLMLSMPVLPPQLTGDYLNRRGKLVQIIKDAAAIK